MLEIQDFTRARDNQKEIILKLQEILQERIETYYATEALNNLAEYDQGDREI